MDALFVLKELEPCLEYLNKAYEKNKDLGIVIRHLEFMSEVGKRELEDNLKTPSFTEQLRSIINRHSMENTSNTPDFILATYLCNCMDSFNAAVNQRSDRYRKDKTS